MITCCFILENNARHVIRSTVLYPGVLYLGDQGYASPAHGKYATSLEA